LIRDRGFPVEASRSSLIIKFDVEGCEARALEGCRETIGRYSPLIFLSCYHKNDDLLLPLLVREMNEKYEFHMRRTRKCFPAWETEFVIFEP